MSNNGGVKSENLNLRTAMLLDITLSNDFPRIKDFPIAQMVKNLPVRQETRVQSLGWEVLWRREWQSTYSCLENSKDREACRATVCGVTKSWTRLHD